MDETSYKIQKETLESLYRLGLIDLLRFQEMFDTSDIDDFGISQKVAKDFINTVNSSKEKK